MSEFTGLEDVDPEEIEKIQFTLYTNNQVLNNSVITHKTDDPNGIIHQEAYEAGMPRRGGIVDARLGTTDNQRNCATCGEGILTCPGHFGHTIFEEPVYNYLMKEFTKNILSCVCLRCSKLLLSKSRKDVENLLKHKSKKYRLNELKRLTKPSRCQNIDNQNNTCNADVTKIKINITNGNFISEDQIIKEDAEGGKDKKKNRLVLTAALVYSIFVNISDEDCILMGFDPKISRPEDMIIKIFPIPPLPIRPSVRQDNLANSSSEDTLQNKLSEMQKANNRIKKEKSKGNITEDELRYKDDFVNQLQHAVSTYQDNDSSIPTSMTKGSNRPTKSISERLKGKTGRIRGNIMGKRTNYSARTVITSNPSISLDELGVPISIAMNVPFPELVGPYNIERLTRAVQNGRNIYPGANYVYQKRNGKIKAINLRSGRSITLEFGDIVERHLVNGDLVLFNRQPTLHKGSTMTHRVVVFKGSTFRLNVSATQPYNADFDGDEMNMYGPMSIQTQIELLISAVYMNIISPKFSQPSIVLKQDTLIAANILNNEEKKIKYHDIMNYVSYINIDITKIKKEDMTTRDFYSLIIPDLINYEDKDLKVVNGQIVKGGVINKSQLNTIIVYIWDKYNPLITKQFIDNTQRIALLYLIEHGFTVGIKDCIASAKLNTDINEYMSKLTLEANCLITEIENNPELLDAELFENNLKMKLSKRGDIGTMTMKSLDYKNNFYRMIASGTKGDATNMGSIMSGWAQEILQKNRIKKNVNNRTTIHFHQNDDTPKARGFISNSYFKGLDPIEVFFHHSSGREGLINTAIKTGETGYAQRKLIKACEDIKVCNDGTVRTSLNLIIQILYGGTNVDPIMQKKVKLFSISMGNEEITNKYFKFSKSLDSEDNKLNENFKKELFEMRDKMRVYQMRASHDYMTIKETYFQGSNYSRIIHDNINIKTNINTLLKIKYIIDSIEFILNHKTTPLLSLIDENKNPIKYNDEKHFKFLFKYMLYEYLAPKRCIEDYKFSKEQFENVITDIINSYNKSLVNYGEMVGIVTAQSCGEPLSQFTLSSFHKTGSETTGRQGIPRFKEIISNTKTQNIGSPMTEIHLSLEYMNNKNMAKKISSFLRYTNMKDITKKVDIIYDPDPDSSLSYTFKDSVDKNSMFSIMSSTKINKLPWLYRLTLSKEVLLDYNISMLNIKTSFISYWEKNYEDPSSIKGKYVKELISKIKNICILTNNSNSPTPVVHIRLDLDNVDSKIFSDILDIFVDKFNIKGSKNIEKIYDILEHKYYNFNNEDKKPEQLAEYVILTDGIDMNKLIHMKIIDMYRTTTNDIQTVYKNYGIEATRMLIVRELTKTFESGSTELNYHHLSLIADLMTAFGSITSIDRHGVNKLDTDPLSRASFEQSLDQLVTAAIYNEVDKMNSISSQVMVGKAFKGGTAYCEILLDHDKLKGIEYNDSLQGYIKKPIKLKSNPLIDSLFE
jgi:DNA-directed RNA polymerase II subunit RPB1